MDWSSLATIQKDTFKLRSIFYLVTPNESSFQHVEDVPRIIDNAFPCYALLMFIELIVTIIRRKPLPGMEDTVTNVFVGSSLRLLNYFVYATFDLFAYNYVWHNWRVATLPWDSKWTWFLAVLLVDFAFYWNHRAHHEVNIMWAIHQTHHGSEDYVLSTATRNSVFQKLFTWAFYLPMSLFIPPAVFFTHVQLNLMVQFMLHTEHVRTLGPLEYVFNTPSHHRVHHGRNRYCIDKNYGGLLIIWDRIFGTFEAEREDEPVVYGLVHPLTTRNTFYLQFGVGHLTHIFKTAWNIEGFSNKVKVFFYGPGWQVGKPRLGNIEDVPEIKYPQPKYSSWVHWSYHVYVLVNTFLQLQLLPRLPYLSEALPYHIFVVQLVYSFWTLGTLTIIYDNSFWGPALELGRCVFALTAWLFTSEEACSILFPFSWYTVLALFTTFTLIWCYMCGTFYNDIKPRRMVKEADRYYYAR